MAAALPAALTPLTSLLNLTTGTRICNRLQVFVNQGSFMTTVYDVARLAGVSTATVSRVVRGSDLVHPETRQRVMAVIEQLGFVPNGSAQGLSRGRKEIIGRVALERGVDEIDIERSSLLFVDQITRAAETVLRGSECS